MKYAVFESGGKQYVAREGQSIDVDKMNVDVGSEVLFDQVLLTSQEGSVHVGQPNVNAAKVRATVIDQVRGPKILVMKYKPRIRYRKRQGHRQQYTRVMIDEISFPGGKKSAAKPKVEAADKPEKTVERPSEPKTEEELSLKKVDLSSMRKAELEEMAEELGVMPEKGSGSGGNVLVKDLREAIEKALK